MNRINGLWRSQLSPLWRTEDWWAVWLAFLLVATALMNLVVHVPVPGGWSSNPFSSLSIQEVPQYLLLGAGVGVITLAAVACMRQGAANYIKGFPLLYLLSLLAFILGNQALFNRYQLDSVLWALVIGLVISNTVGKPSWLEGAVRTELFIKIGLVLLGAEILFNRIMVLGFYGLGVAWLVTPVVFVCMFLLGSRLLKMKSKPMVATISAAASVCGVSAAIAAGASTRARKEEISYAISLSLFFTVFMMVIMPHLINLAGIDMIVGGALIGGTIDSTGAVVVSGSLLGDEAMEVAAIIKMVQNVLIGIVAFLLSLYWVTRVEREEARENDKPSLLEVWRRFPKFIIGFVLASLLFSFVLTPSLGEQKVGEILDVTGGMRGWFFCLAFVSIGLDTKFSKLLELGRGGRPLCLYLTGQLFNVVLTMIAALYFFGVLYLS